MKPVMLSKRLQAVASMVTQGSRVCDVGCDHGWVSIYLVERQICPYVLAMDVRKGPLSAANEHVTERGLASLIETRLSDGLHNYEKGEADSLICAGMGGRLMMRILGENKEKTDSFREMILQPQSELEQFRAWLRGQGYRIVEERMVLEEGKFYPMMRVAPRQSRDCDMGMLGTESVQNRGIGFSRRILPAWLLDYVDCIDDSSAADFTSRMEMILQQAGNEQVLCRLFDRYGAYLLLQGDSVLQDYLKREERIYEEILERLREQGLEDGDGKRRKRYEEVEELLRECRMAFQIIVQIRQGRV